MIAPMLVPPTTSIGTPASSSARMTPRWAIPRAPPPPRTSPQPVPVIILASRVTSPGRLARKWW